MENLGGEGGQGLSVEEGRREASTSQQTEPPLTHCFRLARPTKRASFYFAVVGARFTVDRYIWVDTINW